MGPGGPPRYPGPSRTNANGPGSQNQASNPLLRMGVPPPRAVPSIPHGASPTSSSPMGMVS